jgi:hypothetical protein
LPRLVLGINPTDDVPLSVVHNGPPPTGVCCDHDDDRQNSADNADDHQYPAHLVEVESVLVRLRHRPIEHEPTANTMMLTTSPPAPTMEPPSHC